MTSEPSVSLETIKEFDCNQAFSFQLSLSLSLLPQHCEHAQPHCASFDQRDQHSANNMLAQD